MRKELLWGLGLSFLLTACGNEPDLEAPSYRARPSQILLQGSDGVAYLAHEVIVKVKADVPLEDFASLLQTMGATLDNDEAMPADWPFKRLLLSPRFTADEAINTLVAQGLVESAERNYIMQPFATAVTPNDPRWPELWGMTKIQVNQAWARGTGAAEVVVAISDTGIDYNHPDLAANIWTNPGEIPGNGIDDDKNGYIDDVRGWDWVGNDNNPMDESGHGTHVAGTVGAVGNNGVGVAGANWKVKLVPLRFLGPSGGTSWNGAQTILYAAKIKARVLNASWGCFGPSCYVSYMQNAIAQLNQANGLFVVAAGNNYGNNNDSYPVYPANYAEPNVISVAATGSNDALASFSNYGPTRVHLAAPGVGILSTTPNGQYAAYQGTSMAAPHVAGIAALLLSLRPSLSTLELRQRLLDTADPVPTLAGKILTGGRLNAHKAVLADGEPPPVPTNVQAIPGVQNDITVQWAPVAIEDLGGYRVQWGTSSGSYSQSADVAADQNHLRLTNLTLGQRYYFVVSALDRNGNKSAASIETSAVVVDTTAPPQVIDLRAAALPGQSVNVQVGSASGQYSGYWAAALAADGNPDTAWLTPGRFVSQEEHLLINLDQPAFIDRVELLAPSAYPEFFPVDYDIEVSVDGQTWNTAGGQRGASVQAGDWQHILFPKVYAQAVRIRVLRSHLHASGYAYAGLAEVLVREASLLPDGVELRFTAPGDDPGHGLAMAYDLRVSDKPLTIQNFAQAQAVPTPAPAVAGTQEVIKAKGMVGGHVLYFALTAVDEAGNVSLLSNVATVQPLAIPPGAIKDLRQTHAEPGAFSFSWTSPGADFDVGQAAAYDFRLSRAPITAGNFGAAEAITGLPAPQPAGSLESFTVNNLEEGVLYYFAVRAFDAAGTPGPVSNVVSAQLEFEPDVLPPAVVSDLSVYASQTQQKVVAVVESVSDTLATSFAGSRLLDGNVDTAWISAAGARNKSAWVVLDLGAVASVTRFRMNPGNAGGNLGYYPSAFEVQASADKQNWHNLVRVVNHKAQHGEWNEWAFAPTSTRYLRLHVSERGVVNNEQNQVYVWIGEMEVYALTPESGVDLTWVAPGDDGFVGTASQYELRTSDHPITEDNFAQAAAIATPLPAPGGSVELLRLPALQRESLHHYRLRAIDNAGNVSGLSNEAVIEMPGIPPAPVADLVVTSAERHSVRLQFTATGDDGMLGQATAYDLRYAESPITDETWEAAINVPLPAPMPPGAREQVQVSGLASNTRFYFVLKVVDDKGLRSLPSNVAVAQTLDGIAPGTVSDLTVQLLSSQSAALPAATVISSSDYTEQTPANHVFDGDPTSVWISAARDSATPEFITWQLPENASISTLRLLAAPGYEDLFPQHFRFQIRQDDAQDWQTLVEAADFATSGDWEEWALGTVKARQARLEILQTQSWAGSHYTSVAEIELHSTSSSADRLQLSWTAPGDDAHVGQAQVYDLRQDARPISQASFDQATAVAGVPAPRLAGSLERFTVGNLQPKTTYCYALKARDDVGLSSQASNSPCATTAALPPGAISDLKVTAVSASSVTLAWTAPGAEGSEGQASAYEVRRSSQRITASNWDSATPVPNPPSPGMPGSAQSFTVSGLSGLTLHFFAVRTRNAANATSALSNNAEARTLDNVPPSAVSDLVANPIVERAGAVRISFTAPGDNGPVGQAARYDVRVSPSPITANNFLDGAAVPAPAPRPSGSRETIDIDGLGAEAQYYVALRAIDAAGNVAALSNVASVRTREEAPGVVADLQVVGGRGTEDAHLLLQWTAPGNNGHSGSASAYDIRYATTAITAQNFAQAKVAQGAPAPLVAGSTQSFKLAGLQPDTKYFIALKAIDARKNVSAMSNVAQASTPDEWAPAGVSDLQASTGSIRGSVKLTWTAPGDDGTTGKAQAYEVRYAQHPLTSVNFANGTLVSAPTPAEGGSPQSHVVSALPDEALLYFALRARDNAGNWGALSNAAPAHTPDVAPAAISNLRTLNRSNNSITLTWTAPGDNGTVGTASAYDLRISDLPITVSNFAQAQTVPTPAPHVAGSAQEVLVSGLVSTRTYHFAIKTIDGRGNVSALSNALVAATVDEIAPARVVDLRASTGGGAGSVVLTFTAPGDDGDQGRASAYEVRHAMAPLDETNFASGTLVASGQSPSQAGTQELITINNLKGETVYHFAMRAIDDEGLLAPVSNGAQASTRAVPPAAVLNLQAVAKPGAAMLSWIAPGDDGNEGQASLYDLRYSLSPITPQNFDHAQPVAQAPTPAPAGTAQSVEVTGLLEKKTYHFALKTQDDVGAWSSISNVPQATTPDVTAPAAPQSLSVRAPEPHEGLVLPIKAEASTTLGPSWDVGNVIDGNELTSWASAPTGAQKTVSLTVELEAVKEIDRIRLLPDAFYPQLFPRDFVLETSQNKQSWETVAIEEEFSLSQSAWLSWGFSARKARFVRLTAYGLNASHGQSYALVSEMQVQEAAFPDGRAVLSWIAPGDDGNTGVADKYEVYRALVAFDASTLANAELVSGAPKPAPVGALQSFTATGLAGETTYHWAVRAMDKAGNVGPLSQLAVAKTNPVAPAPVENLVATLVGSNGVKLSWTATGDDHKQGRATSYELRHAPHTLSTQNFAMATLVPGLPPPKIAGAAETFTVAGLQAGKVYRFALLVRDEEGNTSYLSNVAVVATLAPPDVEAPAVVADFEVRLPSEQGVKLGAKVVASSSAQAPQFPASALVDGQRDNAWASLPRTENQLEWVRSDLRDAMVIDRVQLWPSGVQPGLFPPDIEVAVSLDGLAWTVVASERNLQSQAGSPHVLTFAPQSARFVELRATRLAAHDNGLHYAVVAEFDIMTALEPPGTLYAAFTAPLDDGASARAARYELAVSNCPFNATSAQFLPTTSPLPAGTPERFRFTELPQGPLCLAVRSADAVGNMSGWSNIGQADLP